MSMKEGVKRMKRVKILAVGLTAAMVVAGSAIGASAADNNEENATYLLMNIPYSEFYQADLNNDVQVDVYSSATKSKTRASNLAGGSYHTDSSGDTIEGVTFPVKVVGEVDLSSFKKVSDSDSMEITVSLRGKDSTTVYSGKETLFENPTYSYYVLDEEPSFYKEVTQNADGSLTFSEVKGEPEEISADVELTTETKYGDYQINITSDALTSTDEKTVTVYGVVLETKEGTSYGLRHLENIWRNTSLAWCSGYTHEVHGCITKSAHYESMMGQTISKITYFTSEGKKSFATELYVPVKTGASANASDAAVSDGQTSFDTNGFADDFDFTYTVTNAADEAMSMTVQNNMITYPAGTPNGKYTLTVADAKGKYASVVTNFELTAEACAQFNGNILTDSPALIPTDGTDEAAFHDLLDNIAQVTVNDNTFNATGKGAVKLIDAETGLIDTSNTDIFAEDIDTFVMTVKATGYEPFTFTLLRKAEITEPSETSEQSEMSEGSQPDASTDEPSPSESKTSDVFVTPSNDVPKTADTTAFGMIIAALTVSLGTLLLTIRKKKE